MMNLDPPEPLQLGEVFHFTDSEGTTHVLQVTDVKPSDNGGYCIEAKYQEPETPDLVYWSTRGADTT